MEYISEYGGNFLNSFFHTTTPHSDNSIQVFLKSELLCKIGYSIQYFFCNKLFENLKSFHKELKNSLILKLQDSIARTIVHEGLGFISIIFNLSLFSS
jgi:hypothetical protein